MLVKMSRIRKSKTGTKSTGTQTQEIDMELEIARLQEQVKLLKIENEVLRKYTVDKPSDILRESLPNASNLSAPIETTQRTKTTPETLATEHKKENVSSAVLKSSVKSTAKGCSCKGSCSSKICGCVKKDIKCGDLCKCNDLSCMNQGDNYSETNKENLSTINFEHPALQSHNTSKNKQLSNGKSGGLFSPAGDDHEIDPNVEQYSTSLYFGSPKKLTFGSDEDITVKSTETQTKRSRGRPRKDRLKPPSSEYNRKTRSSSNEEKKHDGQLKVDWQAMRRCLSTELDTQSDESSEMKQSTQTRRKNYKQNVIHGMVSLRRGRQKKAEGNTELNENEQTNRRPNPSTMTKKNAKLNEKTEVTNELDSSAVMKTENITPVNIESSIEKADDVSYNSDASPQRIIESSPEVQSDFSSSSKKDDELTLYEADTDFNPMKPKHQLPRTPIRTSSEGDSSKASDTICSFRHQDFEEEEVCTPPADFLQPNVDWEAYQAQLVACKKCNRKFHPYRIKKHAACCKKL